MAETHSDPDRIASSLEDALSAVQASAEATLRAHRALGRELKKMGTAAQNGVLRELQRSLVEAEQLADVLYQSVRSAKRSWQFDDLKHLESGAFTGELLRVARDRGVKLHELDERIVSYPSLVRVLPAEAAVEIDRKREKRIRPSVLARLLQEGQSRPPRFKPDQLFDALLRAYRLALPERPGRDFGATVRLTDIYQILTLFPGQAREYSKQEFARDVCLLDQSGETTREGLRISFPAATGTKTSGTLTTVTKDGERKVYYGVAFRQWQ